MSEHEQWDIVSGVGITALAVAAGRAIESRRDDRLINDPYADALVQAANAPTAIPGPDAEVSGSLGEIWKQMSSYMGVRSKFFDTYFEDAAAAGAKQAVILASGLDTRAFRLSWPDGFRVFEIDQPLVLQFKDSVLDKENVAPSSTRHAIQVDLRDDWATALTNAGFDTSLPTAWLAEGLLPYLPAKAERQLLDTVHEFSAPGSRIAIEHNGGRRSQLVDTDFDALAKEWGFDLRSLFSTEERPEPTDTLTDLGWKITVEPSKQVAEKYGRAFGEFQQRVAPDGQFVIGELV